MQEVKMTVVFTTDVGKIRIKVDGKGKNKTDALTDAYLNAQKLLDLNS